MISNDSGISLGALDKVFSVLNRAKILGDRMLPNGNLLIGRVPHVAPEAWFHQIFAPLKEQEIEELEAKIKRSIPPTFRNCLKIANGLKLFSCSITFYGLRTNYSRKGDAAWQPFDIEPPNTIERPEDAKEAFFCVGGYGWDGSRLYIDNSTSKVFRSEMGNCKPVNVWDSFHEMLVT